MCNCLVGTLQTLQWVDKCQSGEEKEETKSYLGLHGMNLYILLSRKFKFEVLLPVEHSVKKFNNFTDLKDIFEIYACD